MEQDCGFIIQDVPGKGKGIIAQRHFNRGDVVLAEPPVFTLSAESFAGNGASVVVSALARCSEEQQKAFYELNNCHPALPSELALFRTNVLPCGTNDAKTGHKAARGGVFLLGARFNSSCIPNTNNNWDDESGTLVFRAITDVEVGEELCISYGNTLAARDERRKELKEKFGFVCECEACSLSGRALEESDYRRAWLGDMYRNHARGIDGDPLEGMGGAMLALRYLREEGLVVYAPAFYRTGFTFCAAVSDYANARAWALKAYELACMAFGERKAEPWNVLARNPEACQEAGTMSRRTLAGPDSAVWSYLGLI